MTVQYPGTLKESVCLCHHSRPLGHPFLPLISSVPLCSVSAGCCRESMHVVLEGAQGIGHRAAPHFANTGSHPRGSRIVSSSQSRALRTDFQVCVLFRKPQQSEWMDLRDCGVRNRHRQVQVNTSQVHSLAEPTPLGSAELSLLSTFMYCAPRKL